MVSDFSARQKSAVHTLLWLTSPLLPLCSAGGTPAHSGCDPAGEGVLCGEPHHVRYTQGHYHLHTEGRRRQSGPREHLWDDRGEYGSLASSSTNPFFNLPAGRFAVQTLWRSSVSYHSLWTRPVSTMHFCRFQAGKRVGKALHAPLMKLLQQEENLGKKKQKVGFLS